MPQWLNPYPNVPVNEHDLKRISAASTVALMLWRKQVNEELHAIEDMSFYRRPSFLAFNPEEYTEHTCINYSEPHYGGMRYQLDRSTRYALLWAIDTELETRGIFPY